MYTDNPRDGTNPPNVYTRADAVKALEVTLFSLATMEAISSDGAASGQIGCLAEAIEAFSKARYDSAIALAQAAMLPSCVSSKRYHGELEELASEFDRLKRVL